MKTDLKEIIKKIDKLVWNFEYKNGYYYFYTMDPYDFSYQFIGEDIWKDSFYKKLTEEELIDFYNNNNI